MIGIVITLWLTAFFLTVNARNLTTRYEGRTDLYWVSFFMVLAGVWIAIYIPS
jgi:hypothetical protein